MEGEMHIDDRPTGVKMITEIDWSKVVQAIITAASIGGVFLMVQLNTATQLIQRDVTDMKQAMGVFATKEQLDPVRKLAEGALSRAEADTRKQMTDLTILGLERRVSIIEATRQHFDDRK